MKCIQCRGNMKKGTAPLHIDRKGCHIMLDNIHAWVCEQCGEPYFEENEVDGIQELIKAIDQKAQNLTLAA